MLLPHARGKMSVHFKWNAGVFDGELRVDSNRPFYRCFLSYLAMNAREAAGDLALIQICLFSHVNTN